MDLVALTDDWLAQNAALLARRGLQPAWAADGRVQHPVQGDAEQIALALSNVLLNACQHAPAGSTLDLAVQREGRQLLWSLRDHGPGVPDFALPQLGHRFFATANPVDGRKGSGLGLAIVHQVMALHGGSWRAEPAQPGLRLTLLWPLGRTSH